MLAHNQIITYLDVKMRIDTGLMSDVILDAFEKKTYEFQEARQLKRLIQPGERILELGGGLGLVSTLAALNPNTAAVKVFEANPALRPYILEVHERNGVKNVEVVTAVLTDGLQPPTLPFYVRQAFWASSLSLKPPGYVSVVEVPTRSFSAEIESFRPTMIICDIEGGELALFDNANLAGVQKVFMEIHQGVVGRRGIKQLFDSMSARGFHYDQHHSHGSVVLFSHVAREGRGAGARA